MSAYEALACSYDSLTYDIPYEKMLDYMEALLQRHDVRPQSVLDLACGTGSMSVLLAKKGYRVIAADLSEDMLAMAWEKAAELENPPFFMCQSMQELQLPYAVDWVACCLDSLNYVTDPEDCREAFKRVYESLGEGGAFIFDINSEEKLRGLDGQVFLDENEEKEVGQSALTKGDLFAAGLTGGQDSAQRRQELLKKLSLPEHMSANALLAVLNSCYSREEAREILYKK